MGASINSSLDTNGARKGKFFLVPGNLAQAEREGDGLGVAEAKWYRFTPPPTAF